jgi:hypothetical protein
VVEIAIVKLKKYKSPGSGQISAELFQGEGETFLSDIHKLVNSISNKEELPQQWKESVIVPIYRRLIILSTVIILGYHCFQLHNNILSSIVLPRLSPYTKLLGIISVGFSLRDQLPIRFSAFVRYWRKNGHTRRQSMSAGKIS